MTNKEFIHELYNVFPSLTLINTYKNTYTKVLVQDELKIIYNVYPHSLLKSSHPTLNTALNKNEAFKIKANSIHNNKYDYSLVNFIKYNTYVDIICPIHGKFNQQISIHLNKKKPSGCPKCGDARRISSIILTFNTFLERANKTHNNKYSYINSKYKGRSSKIIITCPTHGDFLQTPAAHLQGQGCPVCSNVVKHTTESFINKANNIHNNKYDYTEVVYKNAHSKIKIKCSEHGIFYQTPHNHFKGIGCPKCNISEFSKSGWVSFCNSKNTIPITYVIRCFNNKENFIKIGITSKTVLERYNNKIAMPYNFEIIKEYKGSPSFTYDKEKELHRLFKKHKYDPQISFGGETECFTLDIINLLP